MKPFALTMGDPAGVGPEIVVDAACVALADAANTQRPIHIYGERSILEQALARSAHPLAKSITLNIIETSSGTQFQPGLASAASGRASILAIEAATQDCLRGKCAALITAPINKTALKLAGSPFPGHTEMLAALTRSPHVAMMFASERLNVLLVTIHQSLRNAIDAITIDSVTSAIKFAHNARAYLAIGDRPPKIAVAGLNPHASEDGLFGDEEAKRITPAIDGCRALGIDVTGPYPPDTVFMRAKRGEFDIVIAMTHDHGLIAVKLDGIERAVNVTVGLPFLRASVDHGTAYDIAWQGCASSENLRYVLDWAQRALAS